MTEAVKTLDRTSWRKLRIIIVATLVALTVQGWTGDAVNLFAMFPTGGVEQSLGGVFNGVATTGFLSVWHAFEGIAIFALSLVVLVFSIKAKPKSIRMRNPRTGLRGRGRDWRTSLRVVRVYEQWKLCSDGRRLHWCLRVLLYGTILRKVASLPR